MTIIQSLWIRRCKNCVKVSLIKPILSNENLENNVERFFQASFLEPFMFPRISGISLQIECEKNWFSHEAIFLLQNVWIVKSNRTMFCNHPTWGLQYFVKYSINDFNIWHLEHQVIYFRIERIHVNYAQPENK